MLFVVLAAFRTQVESLPQFFERLLLLKRHIMQRSIRDSKQMDKDSVKWHIHGNQRLRRLSNTSRIQPLVLVKHSTQISSEGLAAHAIVLPERDDTRHQSKQREHTEHTSGKY